MISSPITNSISPTKRGCSPARASRWAASRKPDSILPSAQQDRAAGEAPAGAARSRAAVRGDLRPRDFPRFQARRPHAALHHRRREGRSRPRRDGRGLPDRHRHRPQRRRAGGGGGLRLQQSSSAGTRPDRVISHYDELWDAATALLG